MRRVIATVAVLCVLACGCESLRFGPGQVQKRNAWVHNRTAALAAEAAEDEFTSQQLQELTKLSELQSRAFVAYCGLPAEFPKAESAEDVLSESNVQLARTATSDASERPDAWEVADAAIELGIGVCALLGGVYGTKAVRFLREAKVKSNALKEIVLGNELFKKTNTEYAQAFKDTHRNQSALTRQIVAEMKS